MGSRFHHPAMTPLHPHWQSTEGEEDVPVRARTTGATPVSVSRAPAAIVGILLMLGVVAFSFGGVRAIVGQLANPTPDVTIRLTQDGPDPTPATVKQGQVIRFLNEDQIPHVLTSDTLPTSDGDDFVTTGMFAGSDFFYTVPAGAPDGTHDYISETNPEFSGKIIISAVAVAASSSSIANPPVAASSISSIHALPTSSAVPLPLPTQSSSVAVTPLPAGVIAVNPHVVGAKNAGTSSSKKPGVTQHKPTKNAESGPELWIMLGCAAAAIAIAARGAFRRA